MADIMPHKVLHRSGAINHSYQLFSPQIQARMEAIKQRLQSDPQYRQAFGKQVAKEMHHEQQLEAQFAKQVRCKDSINYDFTREKVTLLYIRPE